MRFIIARYNEDTSWIKHLPCEFTIYNKGEPIDLPNIVRPNIGREAETYLWHIINQYHNLDDYNIFLQGNPFSHYPIFPEVVKNANIFKQDFAFLCRWVGSCHRNDNPDLNIGMYSDKIFKDKLRIFTVGWGAQFVVSKEYICSRPVNFYKRIHRMCLNVEKFPWVLERLWLIIFDPDIPATKYFF